MCVYDIWRMSQQLNFKSADLCEAVRGTFGKRKTTVIEFDDLITELLDSETLQKQWTAFLSKSAVIGPETFAEVLALNGKFLSPVFSSINNNKALNQKWMPPGPWTWSG